LSFALTKNADREDLKRALAPEAADTLGHLASIFRSVNLT